MSDANAKQILVIEDDAAARSSLADALRERGYKIIQAADGEAGLKLALSEQPNLILVDNWMPVMNGTELLAELRANPTGAKIPVVVLTAQYDVKALNETLNAGLTDFLYKDEVSLDDIVSVVEKRIAE